MIKGQCMCGAVTVTVAKLAEAMNACHCEMCRRWTSSAYMAVHAVEADTTFEGPVKIADTSDWARRGWCDDCGSALFYQTKENGAYGLAAGLFDNLGGQTLSIEYFVDQKPEGFAFAGDHKRLTQAETLKYFGVT